MAFRILSIDGGGIRGVIPAVLLAEIERRAEQPVSALFDLVAGTSTGGILALGLTKPGAGGAPAFSAQDLVGLYEQEGAKIFSRSLGYRLLSLNRLASAKYRASGLEDVLDRYLGDTMLSEALTDVVIPSYDIEQRLPIYFTRYFARNRPGFNHRMKDVARSTAAAPTYFEPFRLNTKSEVDHLSMIDGGVFANNPSLAAIAEATGSSGADIGALIVVSLGTGAGAEPIAMKRLIGWGLAAWSTRILDVVLDSVSESVHHQIYYLLRGTASQQDYHRLQPKLARELGRLDKATPANIRELVAVANAFVSEHQAALDAICEKLSDAD